MNSDDYVFDEKRGKAWSNPSEALSWYRDELNKLQDACREWMRGCSCATCSKPWECAECSAAFHQFLLSHGIAPERVTHSGEGCGAPLADGQWWRFCGERDIDSLPALCIQCGGDNRRKD